MQYNIIDPNNSIEINVSNYTWIKVQKSGGTVCYIDVSHTINNVTRVGNLTTGEYEITSDGVIDNVSQFFVELEDVLLKVQKDDVDVLTDVNTINFEGNVDVTNEGTNGKVTVDITSSGGSTDEYETSSESISTTTSTSWQQKLRLSLSDLEAGKYRVDWYYEWAYSNGNFQFRSQIQIDDTDTYMEQEVRPTPASTYKYRDSSGFAYVNLASGDHYIDLDYCSSKFNKTAYIRRARISVRGAL